MDELHLDRVWKIGEKIGGGGFGTVYEASSSEVLAAAKFVPKDPGADREMLFVHLTDVRNVVPVIDSGETKDDWVIVMPRAERSLRADIDAVSGAFPQEEAVAILIDIGDALVDLDGSVVHRDLKPENVLLLEGSWCLADFGISRYAEATTAPDTQKYALTKEYAAPERWRFDHATSTTDIYSLGVIAFELLAGKRPFEGPGLDDYRDQHLHADPPGLEAVSAPLEALVSECLYKAEGARPRAQNVVERLRRTAPEKQAAGGLGRLEEANRREVARRAEHARRESQSQSAEERRGELVEAAGSSLAQVLGPLRAAIVAAAPSARITENGDGWTIQLSDVTLRADRMARVAVSSSDDFAFEAIAHSELNLKIPGRGNDYEGRSHSLWYCDAQGEGDFAWFELAFMVHPMIPERGRQDPFALPPGPDSAGALGPGLAKFQVAWGLGRLAPGELDEFIERWADWLGTAAQGRMGHPTRMPERPTEGWRR